MKVAEKIAACEWLSPPKELVLSEGEVHIWRAPLEFQPAQVQAFLKILSTDEKSKAQRFYFEKDRSHFIAARGILRTILGCYLETDPGSLVFCYKLYGKPALVGENDRTTYNFNLSHSDGLLLLAITRGREVGIDLECIHAELAGQGQEIAERFFSPNEVAKLGSLPTEQKAEAFFKCWTRKEAYVKAKGGGLSVPLDQFEVSLSPGEPAALLHAASSRETSDWSMEELHPGPGYVGALVVQGCALRLRYWQWVEEY
jgi:4'-phosphopantetheinyl transferase